MFGHPRRNPGQRRRKAGRQNFANGLPCRNLIRYIKYDDSYAGRRHRDRNAVRVSRLSPAICAR